MGYDLDKETCMCVETLVGFQQTVGISLSCNTDMFRHFKHLSLNPHFYMPWFLSLFLYIILYVFYAEDD